MVALRKRAEIDSKHLIVLVESDEAEWNASLLKLVSQTCYFSSS